MLTCLVLLTFYWGTGTEEWLHACWDVCQVFKYTSATWHNMSKVKNLFKSQFWVLRAICNLTEASDTKKTNTFRDNLSKIHEGSGPKKLYFWPFHISCCRFKHEKFSIPSVALWHTYPPHRSFCFYTYTQTHFQHRFAHAALIISRWIKRFFLLRFNDVFKPSVSIIQTQNRELAQRLAFRWANHTYTHTHTHLHVTVKLWPSSDSLKIRVRKSCLPHC